MSQIALVHECRFGEVDLKGQQEINLGFRPDEIQIQDPYDEFPEQEEPSWPLRIIDSDTAFDPIEDVEYTGEFKFNRNTLKNKNDFWSYINCTMDARTNFNFNPLIKSNLNNLIEFTSSFQNISHQSADFSNKQCLYL
jgi:hypothetical protein